MNTYEKIQEALSANVQKIQVEPVDKKSLQAEIDELEEEISDTEGQISALEDEVSDMKWRLVKLQKDLETAPESSELPVLMDENRRIEQYMKDLKAGRLRAA